MFYRKQSLRVPRARVLVISGKEFFLQALTRPPSSLSLVPPCTLLPPCDKPEDDWWRVRLGTLTMYALNVTECLVTGKKSRATFSTNQKRNENLFVCASSFDWFIRLSTYAVFYFFHTRLMYWLFTICLMVQVERQDRWRKFSKSSDYMATAFQRSRWLLSENDRSGGVQS